MAKARGKVAPRGSARVYSPPMNLDGLTENQRFVVSMPLDVPPSEVVRRAKKKRLSFTAGTVYNTRTKYRDLIAPPVTNHAGEPVGLKVETEEPEPPAANGAGAAKGEEERERDEQRQRWHAVARSVLLQANEVERDHLILVDRIHARERAVPMMTPAELRFHRKQEALLVRIADWRGEEAKGLRELAELAKELP